MRKFSDFGIEIKSDKEIYEVPKISITDILNCEIEVLEFQSNIKTIHGDDRCVVKISRHETEYKFFTNSKRLKQMLDQVPKDGFPFTTIIIQKRFEYGNGKTYEFT